MGWLLRLATGAALVVLVVFAGLAGYHWYHGAAPSDSVRMAVSDARVAAACPQHPDRVLRFIRRSSLEAHLVGLADRLGADWVGVVCDGALEWGSAFRPL